MFTEIRLYNSTMFIFNGDVKIIKIHMVKFNISILNRLKIMIFFVNIKYVHIHNVIFNKTVTKLVTIWIKCFLPSQNPTSYLNHAVSTNEHLFLKEYTMGLFCGGENDQESMPCSKLRLD